MYELLKTPNKQTKKKKPQNSNVLALNLYDRGIYFQEVQNVK